MSVANDALLVNLGLNQFPVYDNLNSSVTAQGTATRLLGAVNRVTTAAANGSFVLPSLVSLEADSGLIFVINDSAQTIKVFPFTGETNGGVANASLSIPTGQSGIFVAVTAAKTAKGGGIAPGSFANDWRSAAIP